MPKNVLDKDAIILQVIPIALEMYVVINDNGQFFHAVGYGGYGMTWVDDIKDAKIYGKLGPARSRVTWFSSNYPKFSTPKIGVLSITECKIVDETVRVHRSIVAKKKAEVNRQLFDAQQNFERAQAEVASAQRNAESAASKAAAELAILEKQANELNDL